MFETTTVTLPAVRQTTRQQDPIVAKLRATLGTDPQQSELVICDGDDAAAVTKKQGRLNAIGRRNSVDFSVQTRRGALEDGRAAIWAWAVPKRAPKARKRS